MSQPPAEPGAVDFVARLPASLTTEVLAKLGGDPRDLAAAASVCRGWRDAVAEGDVWAAAYGMRFPSWGAEQVLAPRLPPNAAWRQRYRWRLRLDSNWRQGQRRLQRVLHGHAAWVNAVRLLPSVAGSGGGVASGGSEGAVHVWGLDGELHLSSNLHQQTVWTLDADARQIATGAMDGYIHLLDLGSETVTARLPVGWRGGAALLPDEASWEQYEVVTSVQLLPGGQQLLAGCMDGLMQLIDLRCSGAPAQQLHWVAPPPARADGAAGLFWRRRRGVPRLAAARCHDHLVVGAGDAPALSLHDLRAGGSRFAELALRAPSVFSLDLGYPLLATGGDGGHLEVWDLSRLSGSVAAALPAMPQRAQQAKPRLVCSMSAGSSVDAGLGSPAGSPRPQGQQGQGPAGPAGAQQAQQAQQALPSWPSPAAEGHGAARPRPCAAGASSAASASLDCLVGSNEGHLQRGLHPGCVYSVRLMAGGRAISADHGGFVRLWGVDEAAGAGAPTLAALPAFAPSVEDPAAAMVDPGGGPPRPVGMHCLDACLTHLAVAGRDSVVRLYTYE